MAIVLVTKRCFLLCEDIISITLQQLHEPEYNDERRESVLKVKMRNIIGLADLKRFVINIMYVPKNFVGQSHGSCCASSIMQIEVHGYKQALELYTEIVREVREQKPDDRYLDQLVENMFGIVPDNTIR